MGVVFNHISLWMISALNKIEVEPGFASAFLLFFMEFFSPLRMPLFTVISGWVYALMPVTKDNLKPFFLAKIRRIIIPLFFVATVLYFVSGVVNDTYPGIVGRNPQEVLPHQFWKMWFYHFGHLWFLQAIIILFVLIALIDASRAMTNIKQWLFWLGTTIVVYYALPDHIELWSISKTKTILPFFIFGVGLRRFQEQIFSSKFVKFTWPIVAVALLIKYFDWPWILAKHDGILNLVIGTIAPVYLLSLNIKVKPLIWVGKYSYTIYLYHGLPWIFLSTLGLGLLAGGFQWVWIFVFLTSGLLFPVVTETIGVKIPFLRCPILGKKP